LRQSRTKLEPEKRIGRRPFQGTKEPSGVPKRRLHPKNELINKGKLTGANPGSQQALKREKEGISLSFASVGEIPLARGGVIKTRQGTPEWGVNCSMKALKKELRIDGVIWLGKRMTIISIPSGPNQTVRRAMTLIPNVLATETQIQWPGSKGRGAITATDRERMSGAQTGKGRGRLLKGAKSVSRENWSELVEVLLHQYRRKACRQSKATSQRESYVAQGRSGAARGQLTLRPR